MELQRKYLKRDIFSFTFNFFYKILNWLFLRQKVILRMELQSFLISILNGDECSVSLPGTFTPEERFRHAMTTRLVRTHCRLSVWTFQRRE
jgi:hypothetical protein